jgi:hypothetical protein
MPNTKPGRHAAEWTFLRATEDATDIPATGTGQHRANLIHTFRKHVKARFGK